MLLQKLPGEPFGKTGYKSILKSMALQVLLLRLSMNPHSYRQERFVRSVAEAFVQIFSITLSEIGTVVGTTSDGQPVVGPLVDVGETDHAVAEGPFKTIKE